MRRVTFKGGTADGKTIETTQSDGDLIGIPTYDNVQAELPEHRWMLRPDGTTYPPRSKSEWYRVDGEFAVYERTDD